MDSIWDAREQIVKYSRKVQQYGFVSATDGNLSIRLDDNHILITPSGLEKGEMTVDAPIVVDMEGNKVEGDGKPSSEGKLHLEVYRLRQDINAVIHAHPPKCIAFTIAGLPVDTCILPEVVVTMGAVPTSPYATPTTDEVPESIREFILKSDAVMLSRHGSVTVGRCLASAFKLLEKMEHSATIAMYARMLGGPVPFSKEELDRLYNLRSSWGVEKAPLDCTDAGSCSIQEKQRLSAAAKPANTCATYNYDIPEYTPPAYQQPANGTNYDGTTADGTSKKTIDADFDQLVDEITRRVRTILNG
jgi:L-fuculose-phosphate aldolase